MSSLPPTTPTGITTGQPRLTYGIALASSRHKKCLQQPRASPCSSTISHVPRSSGAIANADVLSPRPIASSSTIASVKAAVIAAAPATACRCRHSTPRGDEKLASTKTPATLTNHASMVTAHRLLLLTPSQASSLASPHACSIAMAHRHAKPQPRFRRRSHPLRPLQHIETTSRFDSPALVEPEWSPSHK